MLTAALGYNSSKITGCQLNVRDDLSQRLSLTLLNYYKWQNVRSKISGIMYCILKDTLAITLSHSSQRGSWFFFLCWFPIFMLLLNKWCINIKSAAIYLLLGRVTKRKLNWTKKQWPGRESNLQSRDIWNQLFWKVFCY